MIEFGTATIPELGAKMALTTCVNELLAGSYTVNVMSMPFKKLTSIAGKIRMVDIVGISALGQCRATRIHRSMSLRLRLAAHQR